MNRTYARMEDAIDASKGPWLLGKDLSLADISVMPAVVRMDDLGLGIAWGQAAKDRALVRSDPRAPGVQADISFQLANRPVRASEEAGTVISKKRQTMRMVAREIPYPSG